MLIEAALTAHRERDAEGRILPSPAWHDLSHDQREALFDRQLASREIERLVAPDGLSSTVRAVLERLEGTASRIGGPP